LDLDYTLPDKPADYIHRIGRVGRADAMGLAISIVAKYPEKVWYHQCPSRGKNCNDTRLVEEGGCAIWYQEMQYLQV
jgi:ATP-dependent RNA helicase DDX1